MECVTAEFVAAGLSQWCRVSARLVKRISNRQAEWPRAEEALKQLPGRPAERAAYGAARPLCEAGQVRIEASRIFGPTPKLRINRYAIVERAVSLER